MKRNKIKEILDRHYNGIETPEHLEARLSATIDRLAAQEPLSAQEPPAAQEQLTATAQASTNTCSGTAKRKHQFTVSRRLTPTARRIAAVAAIAILAITVAIFLPKNNKHAIPEDTCATVNEAYRETEEVLNYVSCLMNKGLSKISETQNSFSALQTIHKFIEIKEQ